MDIDFEKIQNYRKQKKITVKGFCELCNIGRTTLWDWEHRKSTPNESKIRTIAKVLGVPANEISSLSAEYNIPDADYNKGIKETVSNWINLLYEDEHTSEISKIKKQLNAVENKLANASTIIQALMTSLQSIFYIKDVKLNYIIANQAFLNILSLKKNYNVIGKKDKDFFSLQEAKSNDEEDRNVLNTGNSITNREGVIPGSRKKKWGITSKYPILSNSGATIGVIAIVSDVTPLRIAAKRRLILEQALDHIKDTCVSIGQFSRKNQENFIFEYMNAEMKELFSITDEADYSKIPELWKNMLPEESKYIYKKRREVQNFPAHFIYKAIRPDNKKTVLLQDSIYKSEERLISIVRDITEQENLTIGQENFEFIFDSIPIAIELIDYNSDKVIYSNNKVKEVFGYTNKEVANWNFWIENIVHPDDKQEQIEYEKADKYPENRIYRIIRPDGKTVKIKNNHIIKTHKGQKYRIVTNSLLQ